MHVGAAVGSERSRLCTQLSRDDPSANKTLSRASLGLAIYGMFIFVFWYIPLLLRYQQVTDHSFGLQPEFQHLRRPSPWLGDGALGVRSGLIYKRMYMYRGLRVRFVIYVWHAYLLGVRARLRSAATARRAGVAEFLR